MASSNESPTKSSLYSKCPHTYLLFDNNPHFFFFLFWRKMENAVRFSEQTLKLFIRLLCVLHFLAQCPPLICENNDILWETTPLPPTSRSENYFWSPWPQWLISKLTHDSFWIIRENTRTFFGNIRKEALSFLWGYQMYKIQAHHNLAKTLEVTAWKWSQHGRKKTEIPRWRDTVSYKYIIPWI